MQLIFSKFTEIRELITQTLDAFCPEKSTANKRERKTAHLRYIFFFAHISIGKSRVGCLSLTVQYSQYVSISCSNFARLCSSFLAAPLEEEEPRCFLGDGSSVVDFDGEARFLRAGGDLVDAAAEVLEEANDDEEHGEGERAAMAVSASLGSLARFLYFRFVGAAGC